MEAIAVDVKRLVHSLFGRMSAVLGALRRHEGSAIKKTRSYRAIGSGQATQDMYGRAGKVDIYSSGEMVKFYRSMSYGKDKPL